MHTVFDERSIEPAEPLIGGLLARLKNHAICDLLLIVLPLLLFVVYSLIYLYRAGLVGEFGFLLLGLSAVSLSLVAAIFFRPRLPTVRSAARLLDERTNAKERFVTLATVNPSSSPVFFSRLRQEAAAYLNRIQIQQEFPYKLKRSFYGSLMVSAVAAILLHLLLPIVQSTIHPVSVPERIRDLAREMLQHPRLSAVARGLETLVSKLEDPKASKSEQQTVVQDMEKKIEDQRKQESQKEERDLLGQAASTLKGLDKQSGGGSDQQKDQDKGGGIQSNLPQQGQGESKQSQGSGGDSKGEINAQMSKEMQQGKTAQGDAKGEASDKNQQMKGQDKNQRGDPDKSEGDKNKETAGKMPSKSQQPGGNSRASEEIPKGSPPPDRLGGEGKTGIKDARYVTVQLPEEAGADSKGESRPGKESNAARSRPKFPVSNVPLPARVPDAPAEVQQMPLEYRGMIH